MSLALALSLVLAGSVLWPSPWADPRSVVWREGRGRQTHSAASMAAVAVSAQLMVITVRAGLPIGTAISQVALHLPRELARDLAPVTDAYEHGDDSAQAWRSALPVWGPVAAAMTVAERAGVAPAALLLGAATTILRRESVARESSIGRVSVRLVLPLGVALLPAFMCTTVIPLVIAMTAGFLGQG